MDGGPLTVDLRGFLRSSITSRRSRPRLLPKAALRPRTLFRALRPGVILASLASTDAPQCNASHRRWHHFPTKSALRPGVVFASLASRHDPLPALRPLMFLSAMRPAEGGKRFPGITSADVLRRITSSRQRASLPDEVGLASCRRQPCVPA